jgi:hypothetical protein
MKTSPAARFILRIRGRVLCLALIGMTGMAFLSGGFLGERTEERTPRPADGTQRLNLSVGDFVVAAR